MSLEPLGDFATEAVPFWVSIPFPATASRVEIVGPDDRVLLTLNASTRVLVDALKAIPVDFGFRDKPAQRRNAMVSKQLH